MKIKLVAIVYCILSSLNVHSQNELDKTIVKRDSLELLKFWKDFKSTVNAGDKHELANYFNFPFYCVPCLDYVSPKDSLTITVEVTESLFQESIFKLFFDLPKLNKYNKDLWSRKYVFTPSYDNDLKKNGFMFSYVRIAPSKFSEGAQGLVFIKRVNGKLKINGIDSVP